MLNNLALKVKWRLLKLYLSSDWQKAEPADLLLVCSDSDRSFNYQDYFYSPLLDSIGDIAARLGGKCICFSDRISTRVGMMAYRKPLNLNRELLCLRMAKKLTIKLGFDAVKVVRYFETKESQLWLKILAKVQPKVVIGIQPRPSLCLACNQQGIPIYDLQHGLISDTLDNPYYFSDRKYVFDAAVLPSGFLCWDECSKAVLEKIGIFSDKEKRVIGNPWFGRFVEQHPDDEVVLSQKAMLPNIDASKPKIFVTLQYGMNEFAGDYVKDGVMVDALNQVIKQTADSYIWFLRLHPSQMLGEQKQKVTVYLEHHFGEYESVSWDMCSNVPMPLLMSMCSLHITHFSSAVVEAANYGIPSALLDPHILPGGKHGDFYQQEIESGIAEVVQITPLAIIEFIERRLNHINVEAKPVYSNVSVTEFLEEKLR